jgi:hypothetical protein
MNKVILSFDYEIYFDGSHNFERLLSNTDEILQIAKKYENKLVFFIDIYYLIKLEENSLSEIYRQLHNQIQLILQNGHDIEYHFHPHWINSKYEKESSTWIFDPSEYSLSDIINKYGKEYASEYFNKGIKKMETEFGYIPCAYRSGGLSINQNQSDLIQLLIDNKFKYDSSVLPGLFMDGTYIHTDHTNAPRTAWWNIGTDSGFLNESKSLSSKLIEIPIMSMRKNALPMYKKILTSIRYRISKIINSIFNKNSEVTGNTLNLGIKKTKSPNSLTFDKSRIQDIMLFKIFTSNYFNNEITVMCILSHPKSFYQQSFQVFESYLKWLNNQKNKYAVSGFKDLF